MTEQSVKHFVKINFLAIEPYKLQNRKILGFTYGAGSKNNEVMKFKEFKYYFAVKKIKFSFHFFDFYFIRRGLKSWPF